MENPGSLAFAADMPGIWGWRLLRQDPGDLDVRGFAFLHALFTLPMRTARAPKYARNTPKQAC